MNFFSKAYYTWLFIGKKKRTIIIVCFALIVAIVLLNVLPFNFNIFPEKQRVKKSAKSQLELFVSNDEVTLNEVYFDHVKAIKFRTRDQDPVGYFEYIEKYHPITDINGIKHNTHLDYLRSKYGENYDPESKNKWAYILTGTYTATHKEFGSIDGEFRMIYVNVERDYDLIEREYGPSEDMLRKVVTKDVSVYALSNYDIKSDVNVEITYIEKVQPTNYYTEYTIYGVVTANDKYNQKHSGKFTAQYETNLTNQYFIQEALEMPALAKQFD